MAFGVERQRETDDGSAEATVGGDQSPIPYWVDVFASDVVNAVGQVGGWLYDQVARGWHVTVIAPDIAEHRPLRILGVGVMDLKSALTGAPRPRAQLLGAATRLLRSHPLAGQLVLSSVSHNESNFAVWGRQLSACMPDAEWVSYEMSPAAYAFKQQALLAAALEQMPPDLGEEFYCPRRRTSLLRQNVTTSCS